MVKPFGWRLGICKLFENKLGDKMMVLLGEDWHIEFLKTPGIK